MKDYQAYGHKTAARLAFYILNCSEEETNEFVSSILNAKKNLKYCSKCFNISDTDPCSICGNPKRDNTSICVVEDVRDIIAMEKTHEFKKIHKTDLIPIGWKRGTGWLGWGKGKAYK